uniref:Uncharacterized protein n=1 Tax=Roseihalotalea indica TaxID=2867963 RepID=A0AA49GRT8_9BACT|nr:hypothetical protein K4G66_02400 [Tunicatimonas sp. TK19036]
MMNSKTFRQQSLPEKLKLLKQFGAHVATRHFNQYQIHLYALDRMLIEVWYTRHFFWKQPIKVEAGLRPDELLEPYLDMIHLDLKLDQ